MRKRMLPKLSDVTKVLVILLLITLCDQSAFCQNNGKVDSLILALEKSPLDTNRICTLIALSGQFIKMHNYELAKQYADDALLFAEQLNYGDGVVDAYDKIAEINVHQGNFPEALNNILSALKQSEEIGNKTLITRSYNNLGVIYDYQGNFTESLKYYLAALRLEEETGNKEGIHRSYNNIGTLYEYHGNYPEALKYHLEALKLSEEIGNKKLIAISHNNIGIIHENQGNLPEALKYYLASLKLEEETGNKAGMADSYNNIGLVYGRQGNHPEALKYHLEALKAREETGNKKGMVQSYRNMGWTYNDQGNYPEGLKNYLAALKLQEELGDKEGIARTYNSIGQTNAMQGNLSEALKNYMSSLKISEEIGDKRSIANSYENIGLIYTDQGNYPEALKSSLAALKLQEELGDKRGMATSFIYIGLVYENQGNYPEALEFYLSSLKLQEELGDNRMIGHTYSQIGEIYVNQGNYPEAMKAYLVALKSAEESNDKFIIAACYKSLGVLNTKLKNSLEAKKYLDDAVSLSFELGSKGLISEAYGGLATLDSLMGNYDQALSHYKKHILYKDSLDNESDDKILAELQTKYETNNKDKEILLLQSEKQIRDLELAMRGESIQRIQADNERIQLKHMLSLQQLDLLSQQQELQQCALEQNQASLTIQEKETALRQDQLNLVNKENEIKTLALKREKLTKNYMFAGIGLLTLLSLVVYNNFKTRQQLKLQTLRNKIASDLHDDVGSTLSSIHIFSEMARNQSKEVLPMLDTISESSKKMMDAMADIVWTINPENDNFEKIMDRMRSFAYELLLARKIDFEFDAKESLNDLKLSMEARKNLYLIFKEATNNMVKYSNADKAHFSLTEAEKMLTMIIHDNGKGFDMQSASSGNGLRNMKRRAEEIGGALRIDSSPGDGTTIQLRVAV